MDFQFVIPQDSGELLNSDGNNYFVKRVHNARDLKDLLNAARIAFSAASDPFYIFDHFDTFFSLIECASPTLLPLLMRSVDLVFLAIDKMGKALATQLADSTAESGSAAAQQPDTTTTADGDAPAAASFDRDAHLNLCKMLMYLSTGLVRAVDGVVAGTLGGGGTPATGGGSGSAKQGKKTGGAILEAEAFDWDDKRFKMMLQVFNVFQLPLEKLWTVCIAEEDFVNMICDMAYRQLEQPAVREKRIADMCFQLLGTAIKRYNHALTFPVRLQQIMRNCELAVVPAANGLHLLAGEFGIASIYAVVLKDLVDTLAVDAADAQTTKHFALFLAELGATQPKLLMPHLAQMGEELLNLDSYVLRNTVLQIMGDTIASELSAEQLSDELKEIRDDFLEDLLNHIVDISAHVRSKVLQIWSHMRAQNAVPLAWQHRVLLAAAERLQDKTALVRKNAVLLIKGFLETNPFAAKLSLAELQAKYAVEEAGLQEVRDRMLAVEERVRDMEERWLAMAEEAMAVIGADLLEQPLVSATAGTSTSTARRASVDAAAAGMAERILEFLLAGELQKAVRLLRSVETPNDAELRALPVEQQVQYYAVLLRSYMFFNKDHSEEYNTQGQTVRFLADSIKFAEVMVQAVPAIENMMLSKTNSDVFESIEFFTTAHLFGIKGTERGMRRMLHLVWSGDKEKREAVTRAYHRVLFDTDQEGRAHTVRVVANLCAFFAALTQGQFSAMEVLMREWIDNDDINNHIIQVLFERLTLKLPDTSEDVARMALQLLVMAAAVRPSIVAANFDLIQSLAFGERSARDPRLFALCLDLLCCQTSGLQSGAGAEPDGLHKRFDGDSELMENTLRCYRTFFFHPAVRDFDAVTISTLNVVYHLGAAPDLIGQQLVAQLVRRLADEAAERRSGGELVDAVSVTQSDDAADTSLEVPAFVAPRLVHLMGYLALKELVYLDIDVYSNMKHRQELADALKKSKKKSRASLTANNITVADGNTSRRLTVGPNVSTSAAMSASKAAKRLSESGGEPQQDPDDVLDGATAEDANAELILDICEKQLYQPQSVCAQFIPVFMDVLQNPARYTDERLQQAASLCLVRYMAVSARFCEANMPLLMNVLQLTQNVRVKCNIMVGLSDITFRFPNVVQSWTSHIYATLHEPNDEIRLTSVKMLSHLIQHEMIRVKGQISDLAMCIVDANEEIRQITLEFFKVIAQKSNILYNVLPDIISRLSGAQAALAEEQYHVIMRYVMGLIQKDRQVESLVEKLCLRFRVTQEKRQWRDIAFCLSLLTYTEKTMRKLIEHIPNFKDKVQEDEVYDSFRVIIAATNKTAKPEFKLIVTEFETKLADCLRVADGKEVTTGAAGSGEAGADALNVSGRSEAEMPPPRHIPTRRGGARGAGRGGRGGGARGGGGGRGATRGRQASARRSSDSDSSNDDDNDEVEAPPQGRGARGQTAAASAASRKPAAGKKPSKVIDTDSESSSDEDAAQKRKRKHR